MEGRGSPAQDISSLAPSAIGQRPGRFPAWTVKLFSFGLVHFWVDSFDFVALSYILKYNGVFLGSQKPLWARPPIMWDFDAIADASPDGTAAASPDATTMQVQMQLRMRVQMQLLVQVQMQLQTQGNSPDMANTWPQRA